MTIEKRNDVEPKQTYDEAKKLTNNSSNRCHEVEECSNSHNEELERRGIQAAELFLRKKHYKILERNWSCSWGEADIIAMDSDDLVFVDVNTRSSNEQGFPIEAVGPKKRDRYEHIALEYLTHSNLCNLPMRFDVIDIVCVDENRAMLRHHVNAFQTA